MNEARLKEKDGEHPLGHASQLISLAVFLLIWVGDSFFLHLSTFLARFIPLQVRLALLCVIFVTVIYLFTTAHAVISHGHRPNFVLRSGAFKYVRHPLYLGIMLTYLGLAFSTASLISLALVVDIFFSYNYIAGYEEELLIERFGDEYRAYRKSTGKWVPRF